MRHVVLALGVLAVASAAAVCAPPRLEIPPEIRPVDGYATYTPGGDVKDVVYVSRDGLLPFPAAFLKDGRSLVVPVKGEKEGRYRFTAVASNDKGELTRADFVVLIGAPPVTPPIDPPATPPPPVNPPAKPPTSFYFLVVRSDGPADPDFTKIMGLPAWGRLRDSGHQFKDKTVTTAAKDLGLTLPAGTPLPCVVTLSVEGGVSKIVRPAVPLPTTDADVLALPTLVK